MSVDYDLVIIGSSAAGVFAASVAANWNARVALVEQEQECLTHAIAHQTLLEVGRTLSQVQRAHRLGLCDTEARSQTWKPQVWKQTQRWAETAERAIAVTDSAAALASRGVEVIAGSGEFHRKPALGFLVNGRSLRSRAYLLAMENLPVIEKPLVKFFSVNPPASTLDIPGLEAAGYQTARTVLQQEAIDHLNRVVILGSNATEVELAQTLQRLGRSVTLVTPAKHILHLEDPQAAYLIQAQLEAEGVQILTQTAVTQVRQISGEKWVQAGNRAIEADEIIAAEAPVDPASLNLAAAQVKSSPWGIVVNRKLQTSNPRIYACLSSLPDSPQVVRYCAETAVKNALFLPVFITDLRSIPIVTYSQPELARVGHSEAIARQLYGNDVVILKQPLKLIPKTQIQGETTGLCKLILRRSGRIVGAHIVAPHASELISPIALAMQQKLTVQALADQIHPTFALSEIIRQTALEWHQTRSNLFQDFLAGLFSLRRSWS